MPRPPMTNPTTRSHAPPRRPRVASRQSRAQRSRSLARCASCADAIPVDMAAPWISDRAAPPSPTIDDQRRAPTLIWGTVLSAPTTGRHNSNGTARRRSSTWMRRSSFVPFAFRSPQVATIMTMPFARSISPYTRSRVCLSISPPPVDQTGPLSGGAVGAASRGT